MTKKATDIVAYLTPLGLILAFVLGDRENSRFHLNQALVLTLCSILMGLVQRVIGWIPLIGWLANWIIGVIGLVWLVLWFIGIASAIGGTEKKVPILGEIQLL